MSPRPNKPLKNRLIVCVSIALVTAFSVTLSTPAPAIAASMTKEQTPVEFVEGIYRNYLDSTGGKGLSLDTNEKIYKFFTDETAKLIIKDREDSQGEVGLIDKDVFVDGQDWSLKNMPKYVMTDHVRDTTIVTFTGVNDLHKKKVVVFQLKNEGKGWRIQNIYWDKSDNSLLNLLHGVPESTTASNDVAVKPEPPKAPLVTSDLSKPSQPPTVAQAPGVAMEADDMIATARECMAAIRVKNWLILEEYSMTGISFNDEVQVEGSSQLNEKYLPKEMNVRYVRYYFRFRSKVAFVDCLLTKTGRIKEVKLTD